jgi:hypothetical protein
VLRVAVDLTSLLTAQTGVGVSALETTRRLATRDDLALTAFAVTWRGRGRLASVVPPNVAVAERPMAARPMRSLWKRANHPRVDWWIGQHDVVWGPNYVVPPTRAASVVTVHDLTAVHFPQLATTDTLAYPRLIQRAIDRGAWVQTSSSFVRNEVIDHFQVDPDRVFPSGSVRSLPATPASGGGSPAATATSWRSAPSSRARTCPRWCGPSISSATVTPTCASWWRARTAGARRRSTPP